jgi:hypothetical protein
MVSQRREGDPAERTVSRRRQLVGESRGGEYEVMTGEPRTLGCGRWICHLDQLKPAGYVAEQPARAA